MLQSKIIFFGFSQKFRSDKIHDDGNKSPFVKKPLERARALLNPAK